MLLNGNSAIDKNLTKKVWKNSEQFVLNWEAGQVRFLLVSYAG